MKGGSRNGKGKGAGLYSGMLGAASAATPRPSEPGTVEKARSAVGVAKSAAAGEAVAVLALSESGEILAAREACQSIFGRDAASLVGLNICVLLRDGFDNDVGRFLHRHRAGKNPAGTVVMRVLALRKDGSEFLAQVTTLTWQWDTAITTKADVSRLCWTAAFRDLGAAPTPPPRRSSDEARVDGSRTERVTKAPAKTLKEEDPVKPSGSMVAPSTPSTPSTKADALPAALVEPTKDSVKAVSPSAPAAAEAGVAPLAAGPGSGATVPAPTPAAAPSKPEAPREDSTAFRTAAQIAAVDLKRQIEDLEGRLRTVIAELDTTKASSERHGLRESELQAQLEAAKEATGFVEAALREETARKEKAEERLQNLSNSLRQEQAERSKRFEADLVSLRQERDELDMRLVREQESASTSTQRVQELEQRLTRNAAEAQRARAELERQSADRQRAESVLREQLDTAWIAKKEIEGAWAGAVERNKQFEEELAKLRQEHDELQARLEAEQRSAADSQERAREVEGRLNRNAAESERARSELQNAERERTDAEWAAELEVERERRTKLEAALQEASDRCRKVEQELDVLRGERDEARTLLVAEQKAAAAARDQAETAASQSGQDGAEVERLRRELKDRQTDFDRACAALRDQLIAANSRAVDLETQVGAVTNREQRHEKEAAALRQQQDEWNAKAGAAKEVAAQAAERVQALESQLKQKTAELEQLQSDIGKFQSDHERSSAKAGKELEAARTACSKLEASLAEAEALRQRAADELTAARQERDELKTRCKAETRSAAETSQHAEELRQQLERQREEARQLSAELDRIRDEHAQAEARWQEQLVAAQDQARKLETDWTVAVERNVRLEEELVQKETEHEEALLKARSELKSSAQSVQQTAELERRLERIQGELKRTQAELEKSRADRERVQVDGQQQLESTKALVKKLEAARTAASERTRRLESEVAALRQERDELSGELAAVSQDSAGAQERTDELASELERRAAELESTKQELTRLNSAHEQQRHQWCEEQETLRAEKVELEEVLTGVAERNRRLESELAGLRCKAVAVETVPAVARPASTAAPAVSVTPKAKASSPAAPRPVTGKTSDASKELAPSPGSVQQYNFDLPKPAPRRETRTSKRKLQP